MLLDFSPAMVIVLVLRLAEGATNAEHPVTKDGDKIVSAI